ncbi:TIR domain-containing protein [Pseudorhodoferax sp.]|uniref:nSTAND1 domain-containing NTPase n=1 Tax=Pseudorhodoferax sp. TaxID=1993553 RepID=UPI0039E68E31
MGEPLLFLSHAGCDTEAALALARRIEAAPAARARGLRVWVDKRDLRPGTPWMDQLEYAIAQESTAFAVYLSEAGAEHWVRMEVRVALDRVIADGRRGAHYPFLPVVERNLLDIARLPPFARHYQGVALSADDGLQQLIAAVLGDAAEPRRIALVDEPFRGLEAFGADHAHLFFGRDQETRELLDRLRTQSLVMVVADSGAGKSSLVQAGVVPGFREGRLADPGAPRPGPGSWHVVQMRPLNVPLQALVDAVSDSARDVPDLQAALFDQACSRLKQGDASALADVLRAGAPRGAQVLLVVDQFEELWTQTLDGRLRTTFLDGLLLAVAPVDRRVRVVATMRRDHFFQTASHAGLYQRLEADGRAACFSLRRMADTQLRDCIEKPLALAGVDARQAAVLAAEVLRDVGGEPGELALVEMALFKTWAERNRHPTLLDAYKDIGRVEGALAYAAEEALHRLGPARAALAETVFVRLVTQSAEGGVTRRRAHRDEFAPAAWAVAQQLGTRESNRLLVLGREPAEGERAGGAALSAAAGDASHTVELAHEQIATQWVRYGQWLRGVDGQAEDKGALDRLIVRVQDWVAGGRRWREATAGRGERIAFDRLRQRRGHWMSVDEQSFTRLAYYVAGLPWALAGFGVVVAVFGGGMWILQQQVRLVDAEANEIGHQLAPVQQVQQLDDEAVRQLMTADEKVRLAFAIKLRSDPGLARLFSRHAWVITRALAGRSAALRDQLIQQVVMPASDAAGFDTLRAVASLGVGLSTPHAIEPLLQAMGATTDVGALRALGEGLAAVAAKLDAQQAGRAIEPLLQAMGATWDADALRALSQGLAAVAAKLDAQQAGRAIEPLLQAMGATTDAFALRALGEGLAAVAAKLDAQQAGRAIEPLLQAMGATTDAVALGALGEGLAAVPAKLDAQQAGRAIERVLQAMGATRDADALRALGQGLAAVAAKLDAQQAGRAIERVLQAMGATTDADALRALGQGLAAVPAKLDAQQAGRAIEPLLRAMGATTNALALRALGQGLAAVAAKLDAQQAGRAIERVLQAMGATTNALALGALGQGLAAVPAKLDAQQAGRAIEPVLQAMGAATNAGALGALSQGLAAVAVKLDAKQAAMAIQSALAIPFSDRETVDRLLQPIHQRPPAGMPASATLWDVLAWVPGRP